MNVSALPSATRLSIDDRGTIAAMEDLFAMLAGLITASGGCFAIAGRDVHDATVVERAHVLTGMYDAGEVIVGYADARTGDVVNMVIEHLIPEVGHHADGQTRPIWRALIYVEEPEGHTLRGVIAAATWQALAQQVLDAVTDGLRKPLPDQRHVMTPVASR
jgi:hypothetical protein